MKNKTQITLLVITLITFIVLVSVAAYAYFSGDINIASDGSAEVSLPSNMYVFTSSSQGEISLSVSAVDMQKDNASLDAISYDDASISISLSSANADTLTRCSYDLVWVWDDNSDEYSPDVTLPYVSGDNTYNYEMSVGVTGVSGSEKDISLLVNNVILSNEAIESSSLQATSKVYNVYSKIYNLPLNQANIKGKTFSGKVTVSNINCAMSDIDNEITLYIETGVDTNIYQQTSIDSTKTYQINTNKTTCSGASYDSANHKVNVSVSPGQSCSVYLDRLS